jgi:hypothetical protein
MRVDFGLSRRELESLESLRGTQQPDEEAFGDPFELVADFEGFEDDPDYQLNGEVITFWMQNVLSRLHHDNPANRDLFWPLIAHRRFSDDDDRDPLQMLELPGDLPDTDNRIFVPVQLFMENETYHYVLLVIDNTTRMVYILDSMNDPEGEAEEEEITEDDEVYQVAQHILGYIGRPNYRIGSSLVPQQTNLIDCGLFVCINAWLLTHGVSLPLENRYLTDDSAWLRTWLEFHLRCGRQGRIASSLRRVRVS